MATVKVVLNKGLTIGEETHLEAELREASAGDLIDATDESEKLTLTPDGYQLIASPTQVGLNTLRRQVVRLGSYVGPLAMTELKKLSAVDISLLQEGAARLDTATMEEVAKRGRVDQASA